MSTAVIRYQVRPAAAEENQRLIEAVFAELAAVAPPGLRYTALRLADGVSFVHVVDGDGLADLPAFQDFQRGLAGRLAAGPARDDAALIGAYPPADGALSRPPASSRTGAAAVPR